jgi:hypothetical protein
VCSNAITANVRKEKRKKEGIEVWNDARCNEAERLTRDGGSVDGWKKRPTEAHMHKRAASAHEKLAGRDFSTAFGPAVAFSQRSNSFPRPGNSYKAEKLVGIYFEWLADGIRHALTQADEVARNGVLQRMTSARGFLGHPLLFVPA